MKKILEKDNEYILRFDESEDIISGIKKFCGEEGFEAGTFTCIGACSLVELSFYKLEEKEYRKKTIEEELEITGIIGNITRKDGEVVVHAHGNFGDSEMKVWGGHVNKAIISATGEVMLRKLEGKINRDFDERTYLNLMK